LLTMLGFRIVERAAEEVNFRSLIEALCSIHRGRKTAN
jgi:hypothetical protein